MPWIVWIESNRIIGFQDFQRLILWIFFLTVFNSERHLGKMVHRLNGREDLAFMTSQRLKSFTSLLLPALYAQNLCQSYRSSLRHNLVSDSDNDDSATAWLCSIVVSVLCIVWSGPAAASGHQGSATPRILHSAATVVLVSPPPPALITATLLIVTTLLGISNEHPAYANLGKTLKPS